MDIAIFSSVPVPLFPKPKQNSVLLSFNRSYLSVRSAELGPSVENAAVSFGHAPQMKLRS